MQCSVLRPVCLSPRKIRVITVAGLFAFFASRLVHDSIHQREINAWLEQNTLSGSAATAANQHGWSLSERWKGCKTEGGFAVPDVIIPA